MRQARLLVPANMDGVYHVVSRVVDRRMVFGPEEKNHFIRLFKAYAGFSGISPLSWCVMDNHFHLLVSVPADGGQRPTEAEVLRRMALVYNRTVMAGILHVLDQCQGEEARSKVLEPYVRRMGDLGLFMKTLKQRFTQWFNRRHQRKGTLWEDRYHSTVVECPDGWQETDAAAGIGLSGHATRIVAAYIDLNPVRAGVVEDPKDYSWSSYGMAVGGDKVARTGLARLWGELPGKALCTHRVFVFGEGSAEREEAGSQKHRRVAIDARKVWAERERGGRLPMPVLLCLRVRYLGSGAVVGSKEFIGRVMAGRGERKIGVPMRYGEWGGLYALRNLRVRVVE